MIVAPILVLALSFLASGRLLSGVRLVGVVLLILAVDFYVVTFGDLLERRLGGVVRATVETETTDEE